MYHILIYVIVFVGTECSPVFDSDNMVKPRFERNKVNKGVWLRNRQEPMKTSLGFIFRPNSLDVESQVQNGFDTFNSKQDAMASEFVGRYKREPHSKINRRRRKVNDKSKNSTSTYINHYPYEVTVLWDSPNNKNIDYNVFPNASSRNLVEERNDTVQAVTESKIDNTKESKEENKISQKQKDIPFEYLGDIVNFTSANVSIPKRSMKYRSENDRINLLEAVNTNSNVINDNNFEKEVKTWQIAPVTDVVYEIVPKENKDEQRPFKSVSERGLIKVLSMLTKTFKKIMKQHNDIKGINTQMNDLNEGLKMNIEKHSKRLDDFDAKYAFFLKIMEKLKILQDKLKSKEEGYKKKEEEMSRYLLKLEEQQKTFLRQQQQFFNVQKAMLAQNEKINHKQNAIAKTQNDISLRQNNYARILEKAKKQFFESKHPQLTTTLGGRKIVFSNVTKEKNHDEQSTTTEPISINLFSIPATNPILNQDEMILREIDNKPVDDLIYKFYFNNTFIDTIIKNKILPGFNIADKTAIARNAKHKRNKHKSNYSKTNISTGTDGKLDKTILLPVYNETNTTSRRERRWINHHSRKRHHKHHGKRNSAPTHHSLFISEISNTNNIKTTADPIAVKSNVIADNPFMKMATHFCNEIGQSSTKQILDWCVEKAIRKLQSLDTKLVASPPETTNNVQETTHLHITEWPYTSPESKITKQTEHVTEVPAVSLPTTQLSTTKNVAITETVSVSVPNAFFPDNEELETDLKQFELTSDPAGNVYYDGSLHASDVGVRDKSDSVSDIIPGFEGSSRVDLVNRIFTQPAMKKLHNNRIQSLKRSQRIRRL